MKNTLLRTLIALSVAENFIMYYSFESYEVERRFKVFIFSTTPESTTEPIHLPNPYFLTVNIPYCKIKTVNTVKQPTTLKTPNKGT